MSTFNCHAIINTTKIFSGYYLEQTSRQNYKKGIMIKIIKSITRLKAVICILFSNIAFSFLLINKMPKILNKKGKCDNWTQQYKTPKINTKQQMQNLSTPFCRRCPENIVPCSGHPAKCAVTDKGISITLAAIPCINKVNTYNQPTYSLSCINAEIKQLANIKIYKYYLKRGHLRN